jgi:hypothetical protein
MKENVMLKPSDIPKSWRDMLEDLQKEYPYVVLAGGALRDLDHGIKVKDLDVFVQCGDTMQEAEGLNQKLGGKSAGDPDANQWYGQSGMQEIIMVSDYDKKKKVIRNLPDIPVQLIFVNWKVASVWKRFDYGLCQIMYDGDKVYYTSKYVSGKTDKEFELVRCETTHALERSVERYVRWKPRYPDHRFRGGSVIPFVEEAIAIDIPIEVFSN